MKKTRHEPGTPSWADLATSDLEAAKTFYAGLFGWDMHVTPEPEAGGYTLAQLGEDPVAGLGAVTSEGQPTAWTVYFASGDVDSIAAAVDSAGGKVLAAPFDVMGQGRMGVFADESGAPFGVWQPYAMPGAGRLREPGAICWVELLTRDPVGATGFYDQVFGWIPHANDDVEFPYTEFGLGGDTFAGMMPMGEQFPPDVPPHWVVYFEVPDVDAAAARAAELGGTVTMPGTDIPPGRFAVLNDPQGAVFAVFTPGPGRRD